MTRRVLLAAAAAVLAFAACTGDDDAGPSPTTQPPTSTSTVDLSGVALPGVAGETTTTIEETGRTRLVGSVRGPAGPLAGATVQVDRLVAGREVRHVVISGPEGRWELRDVPGGRYRVRAYLAPLYAQTTAEVRFLAADDEHSFDLVVDEQSGVIVRSDVAPDQPTLDAAVNLVVLVVRRTVTPDGVVRSTPLVGATVELSGLSRWVLRDDEVIGGDDGTTSTTFDSGPSAFELLSSEGRARFELRCLTAGAPGLALRVPVPSDAGAPSSDGSVTVEVVSLDLPACIDPAATTTTTSEGGSTSSTTP